MPPFPPPFHLPTRSLVFPLLSFVLLPLFPPLIILMFFILRLLICFLLTPPLLLRLALPLHARRRRRAQTTARPRRGRRSAGEGFELSTRRRFTRSTPALGRAAYLGGGGEGWVGPS